MPLFFFLSGYVCKYEENCSFNEILKKNVYRLLIPYFFFKILGYCWWLYFSFYSHPELFPRDGLTILKPLLGIILGLSYDTDYSYTVCTPVWFLLALFWLKITVRLYLNNIKLCCFFFILFAIFLKMLALKECHLFFNIDNAMMVFPFFVLGYYCRKKYLAEQKYGTQFCNALLLFVLLLFIILVPFNNRVDVNTLNGGKSFLLFYFISGLGIMLFISIVKHLFSYISVSSKLASGTIVIIGMHQYFISIFYALKIEYVFSFFIVLLILLIHIPVIYLFQKFVPLLVGMKRC